MKMDMVAVRVGEHATLLHAGTLWVALAPVKVDHPFTGTILLPSSAGRSASQYREKRKKCSLVAR